MNLKAPSYSVITENAKFRIERARYPATTKQSEYFKLIKTYCSPVFQTNPIDPLVLERLSSCKKVFLVPDDITNNQVIYPDVGYEPINDIVSDLEISFNGKLEVVLSLLQCIEELQLASLNLSSLSLESIYINPLTLEIILTDVLSLVATDGPRQNIKLSQRLAKDLSSIFSYILNIDENANERNNHQLLQYPQIEALLDLLNQRGYLNLTSLRKDFERIKNYLFDLGMCPAFKLNQSDYESVDGDILFHSSSSSRFLSKKIYDAIIAGHGFIVVCGQDGVGKSTTILNSVKLKKDAAIYFSHNSIDYEPYATLDNIFRQCTDFFVSQFGIEKIRSKLSQYAEQLSLVCKSVSQITEKKISISNKDQISHSKLLEEIKALSKIFLNAPILLHFKDISHIDPTSFGLLLRIAQYELANLIVIIEANDKVSIEKIIGKTGNKKVSFVNYYSFSLTDVEEYLSAFLSPTHCDIKELADCLYRYTNGVINYLDKSLKGLFDEKVIFIEEGFLYWSIEDVKFVLSQRYEFSTNFDFEKLSQEEVEFLSILCIVGKPISIESYSKLVGKKVTSIQKYIDGLFEKKLLNRDANHWVFPAERCDTESILNLWNSFEYSNRKRRFTHNVVLLLEGKDAPLSFYTLIEIVSHMRTDDLYQQIEEFGDRYIARLMLVVGSYAVVKKQWDTGAKFYMEFLEVAEKHTVPINQLIFAIQQAIFIDRIRGNLSNLEISFNKLIQYADANAIASSSIDVITAYKLKGRYIDAIHLGIKMLRLLGLNIPKKVGYIHILKDYLFAKYLLSKEKNVISKQECKDRKVILQTQIMVELGIACYNASSEDDDYRYELMMPYFALRCLNISLRCGYTEFSSHALVAYGLLCHMLQGNINEAYKYYNIGKTLRERFSGNNENDLGLEFYFHGMIQCWREPVQHSISALEKVKSQAFHQGQLEFAGFHSGAYFAFRLISGENYQLLKEDLANELPRIISLRHQTAEYIHKIYYEHLEDLTSNFKPDEFEPIDDVKRKYGSNASVLFAVFFLRMLAHFYGGNWEISAKYYREARKRINTGGRGLPYLGYLKLFGTINQIKLIRSKNRNLFTSPLSFYYVTSAIIWLGFWSIKERKVFAPKFLLLLAEYISTKKLPGRMIKGLFTKALILAEKEDLSTELNIGNELYADYLIAKNEYSEALKYYSKSYNGFLRQGIPLKYSQLKNLISDLKVKFNKSTDTQYYQLLAKLFNTPTLEGIAFDAIKCAEQCFLPKRIIIGFSSNQVLRVVAVYENNNYHYVNTGYHGYRNISKPLVAMALDSASVLYIPDPRSNNSLRNDSYSFGLNQNISCVSFGKGSPQSGFIYMEGVSINPDLISQDNDLIQCLKSRIQTILLSYHESREKDTALRETDVAQQRDNNLSHEIRTPLNGIANLSRMCLEDKLDDETLHKYLGIINSEAEEVNNLVDDILTARNIEEGKVILRTDVIHLKNTLDSLLNWFEINTRNRNITLNYPSYSCLPEYIEIDKTKFNQIVRNLLTNAYKFTDQGSVTVSVEMASQQGDTIHLFLKVRDTGCGINSNELANVFEKGYQADSTLKQGYRGNGLGLWMVRTFARKMGGDARISSKVGSGTEVFVTLLAKKASGILNPSDTSIRKKVTSIGKRILIAEDHYANQIVMNGLLSSFDVDVVIVENGQEAVNCCLKEHYDLVILDLNMPVMDGYKACEEIRQIEGMGNIPIVAISAHGDSLLKEVKQCGFNDYLRKPINEASFREKMNNWISVSAVAKSNKLIGILNNITLSYFSKAIVEDKILNSPVGFTITIQTFEEYYYKPIYGLAHGTVHLERTKIIEIFHQLASHAEGIGLDSVAELAKLIEEKVEERVAFQTEIDAISRILKESLPDIRSIADAIRERVMNTPKEIKVATDDELHQFIIHLKNNSMKCLNLLEKVKNKVDMEQAKEIESLVYEGSYEEALRCIENIFPN